MNRGCARLEAWGLRVIVAPVAGADDRYLAGSDDCRRDALHSLVRNADVDIVIAARGGYGCSRLLDTIDWGLLAARRPRMVGYSDISVLHLAMFASGIATGVSGPMVAVEFARELESRPDHEAFSFAMRSLAEVWEPARCALPRGTRLHALKPGSARGPLVPVTLSVLASLVGTPYMPDLTGAILVLEDVNEAAYKLDRYLTQLRQAGVLKRLGALVFGSFSDCEDAEWIPSVLAEFAGYIRGPVAGGLPYGHCFPSVTLPVGGPGELECPPQGMPRLRWRYSEPRRDRSCESRPPAPRSCS